MRDQANYKSCFRVTQLFNMDGDLKKNDVSIDHYGESDIVMLNKGHSYPQIYVFNITNTKVILKLDFAE